MAKVTGPLFSVSASGAVGKSIVFFQLPHCVGKTPVRQWTVPANPQTTDQGDVRLKLQAAGRVARRVQAGSTLREQIQSVTPTGHIWNSYYVTSMLGRNMANVDTALSQWDGLDPSLQDDWESQATQIPLEASSVAYSDVGDISPGQALYIAAYGAYMLGVAAADTAPETWDATKIGDFSLAFIE